MFFFTNYTWQNVLMLFGLFFILLLLNELTRRNKWLAVLSYIILPICLTAFLWPKSAGAGTSSGYWFAWVKTYSALAGVIGFMLIRYNKKIGDSKFKIYFPIAILAINIIEAIYRDFECYFKYTNNTVVENGLTMMGGSWNIINGVAGILLLLTLTGWVGIKVAKTKSQDMVWADQLWFWIIAYDFWNIAYCYNCISDRSMYAAVLIIVACTVAEFLIKRGVWLQHRAQTLAWWGMFSLSLNYADYPLFNITSTHNPAALITLSSLALISTFAVAVFETYIIIKKKRNPLKEDMFVDLRSYKLNLEANGL